MKLRWAITPTQNREEKFISKSINKWSLDPLLGGTCFLKQNKVEIYNEKFSLK
jgi:hypothetical protein